MAQVAAQGVTPEAKSDFYALFAHGPLAALFSAVFLADVAALGMSAARFWRAIRSGGASANTPAGAIAEAADDVLRLRYLGGGHGQGCNDADDRFTLWRRRFHHATFYSFLLCLAATAAGTFMHFALGQHAPYPFLSLPVLLGALGGTGLLMGPAGLLWLNARRDPALLDPAQRPMDRGFTALLAARATAAMGPLLALHLGTVLAFFLTLPCGKFTHGILRSAALQQEVDDSPSGLSIIRSIGRGLHPLPIRSPKPRPCRPGTAPAALKGGVSNRGQFYDQKCG